MRMASEIMKSAKLRNKTISSNRATANSKTSFLSGIPWNSLFIIYFANFNWRRSLQKGLGSPAFRYSSKLYFFKRGMIRKFNRFNPRKQNIMPIETTFRNIMLISLWIEQKRDFHSIVWSIFKKWTCALFLSDHLFDDPLILFKEKKRRPITECRHRKHHK